METRGGKRKLTDKMRYPLCHLVAYFLIYLHALRHLYAEQRHAVLQRLANVLCQNETHNLLLLRLGVEDGVVVVELVERLCELVAVVGDA